MKIDAAQLTGFLFLNVSRQYAIDEDLYSLIVNSGEETTSAIHRRLAQNVKDRYFMDYQFYLFAARNRRVKGVSRHATRHDSTQATLDKHLQPKQKESSEKREVKRTELALKSKRQNLNLAKAQVEDEIDFAPLIKLKTVRNDRGLMLPTMGSQKLTRLVEHGITNAKALLQFEDTGGIFRDAWGRSPLDTWKDIAQAEYLNREAVVKERTKEFLEAQREHHLAVCRVKPQEEKDKDSNPKRQCRTACRRRAA